MSPAVKKLICEMLEAAASAKAQGEDEVLAAMVPVAKATVRKPYVEN